jgi:hypothetical protein
LIYINEIELKEKKKIFEKKEKFWNKTMTSLKELKEEYESLFEKEVKLETIINHFFVTLFS